jgi:hypothetical protein
MLTWPFQASQIRPLRPLRGGYVGREPAVSSCYGECHGRRSAPGCDLDYAIDVAGAHPIAQSRVSVRVPGSAGGVTAGGARHQGRGRAQDSAQISPWEP